MAKAKKQEKPIEQRLEEALVLYEKTPYNLPSNWCWVKFKNLCRVMNGYAFKSSKYIDNGIRIIRITNVQDGFIEDNKPVYYSQTDIKGLEWSLLKENDIVVSLTGNVGRAAIIPKDMLPAALNQRVACLRPDIFLDQRYIYYYLLSGDFRKNCLGSAKGIAQQNMSTEAINELTFPLAPLEEQKRIVDIIEKQFAKLDEAKDLIQKSLDSFADRKSAILHKAFTGELTEKWRRKRGLEYTPISTLLKNCCKISSGGTPSRKHPEYYKGTIPWIKTGEINWNEIYDAEEHINEVAIKNSSAKCYDPGVVLVAMYGMGVTRGRAAILKVRAATNQAVCVLKPNSELLTKYLYYYFMCFHLNIREQAVGGNQLNLSGKIISQLKITIPSLEEQEEIVRILDSIFDKEDKSKELIDMIDKIDEMKKSILARAFRGELGTSNPDDEPAIDFLRKILVKNI